MLKKDCVGIGNRMTAMDAFDGLLRGSYESFICFSFEQIKIGMLLYP